LESGLIMGYDTLRREMQAIQNQADAYQRRSPLSAETHMHNIARSLSQDYGISSIADIGVRQVPNYQIESVIETWGGEGRYYYMGVDSGKEYDREGLIPLGRPGEGFNNYFQKKTQVGTRNEYFNKNNPSIVIPESRFASTGEGEGYSNYNLQPVQQADGSTIVVPVQWYEKSGMGAFAEEIAPILQVGALALLFVPGLGQAVGASILSAAGITGASAAVTASVGAAAIAAGTTALQGGSVEDVLKAGISAGAASGVNFAIGGGIEGAAAGSAVGTAIKGGDASQVLTNAFAAGVGAGVQGALPDSPDAGKILGSAARTYIATGGDVDQTLLNTAATSVGTFYDKQNPAPIESRTEEQQGQATTAPSVVTTSQQTSTGLELSPPTVSETPIKLGDTYYYPMSNGGAAYTDEKGINRYISAAEFAADKATFGVSDLSTIVPPADVATATLDPQTIVATRPDLSPVVTDLDLVKKVGAQPTPTVDPTELERVIVQGQKETANTAPVVTDIAEVRPDTTRGLPVPTAELPPVTVTGKQEKEVAPTVTELPPLNYIGQPLTITGRGQPTTELDPVTITGKREKEVAPTVTELPPLNYIGQPLTITGRGQPTTELDPVTITGKREKEVAPTVTELDPVTIVGKRDPIYELDPVTITGKREYELDPVTITGKQEDDVISEDTLSKKEEPEEEPKRETKKIYPTVTSVPPPKRPRTSPIITGAITGASPARLLADALAAYRPAGEIEGEESGKERQNVWNEKSLRLKDALGL
jgi:hypothetical protein